MSKADLIVSWYDDPQGNMTFRDIGRKLGWNPERVRSAYRRAKGTHTRQSVDSVEDEDDETFEYDRFVSHKIDSDVVARVAFPTDLHCPYQDNYAVQLALLIIRDFNPHVLVCGSDGVDFYGLSVFDKNPLRSRDIYGEVREWKRVQREFNDAVSPLTEKIFLIGNHEDRLRRHNWRKNPEMASHPSLQLESIMQLSDVGIIQPAAHEIIINDVLAIKHGSKVSKYSAYTAKAELLDEMYAINTMTGHTHRGGTHFATTRNGVVRADECYCLCDLSPEYTHRPNWQHGIALATVIGQNVFVESIPFSGAGKHKVAFWRGKKYTI